uniref:Uncharacterized protein n=1 Tax=Oryza glumipatula TaxID=40148 RepID=A0A0D9ZYI1_9ORYZ
MTVDLLCAYVMLGRYTKISAKRHVINPLFLDIHCWSLGSSPTAEAKCDSPAVLVVAYAMLFLVMQQRCRSCFLQLQKSTFRPFRPAYLAGDGCCRRLLLRAEQPEHGGDHVSGGERQLLLQHQHLREQQRAGGDQLGAGQEQGGHERPRSSHPPPASSPPMPDQAEEEDGGGDGDDDGNGGHEELPVICRNDPHRHSGSAAVSSALYVDVLIDLILWGRGF